MNKRNFVTGFQPGKADFDGIQNDIESGLNRVAKVIAGKGIESGFTVTIAGSTATVTAGRAFDGVGNPIVATAPVTVDLGAITRPATGKYKWATIVLQYQVAEAGSVVDLYNNTHPAQYQDSLTALILEGTEGSATAITPPAHTNTQVPIIDIRVDATGAWETLATDSGRRPALIPVAEASSRLQRHEGNTGSAAHGATSAATAHQIVTRDAQGRAQVAAPVAAADIARKDTVDSHAAVTATASAAVHGIRQGTGHGFDADKLDGKHLDEVLKLAWPVGSVYVQFPGFSAPMTLGFPGRWSATDNRVKALQDMFFRVEKSGNGFGTSQGDMLQGFTFGSGTNILKSSTRSYRTNGATNGFLNIWDVGISAKGGMRNTTWGDADLSIVAHNNGSPRVGNETRPKNRAIRLWVRTS